MKKVLYTEIQHFRQLWLWVLLLGILIFPFWEIISDFENENSNNYFDWFFLGGMSLFIWFFYKLQLKTVISEQDISIRFNFFHRKPKTISWDEIQKAEIITYNPVMDYGGWGIRYGGLNSVAYNVSGNQGLQLYLNNGKKILIGTQKPDELQNIIKKMASEL